MTDLLVYNIQVPRPLSPKEGWIHTAVIYVPAFSTFPVDMLRYDGCWPATSEDANKLRLTIVERSEVPLAIHVKKCGPDKRNPGWTPKRWASFGVRLQAAGEAPPVEVQRLAVPNPA